MALTTEDAARLADLRAAYDKLIKGEKVASVTAFGRRKDYAQADLKRLKDEIDDLAAQAATTTGRRRGAIGFRF